MAWTLNRYVLVFALLAFAAMPAICSPASDNSARAKIGLVLSGGGARGAAHVGVIKVLDEMRIPVDFIAGTSMGAIVGGLYASGMDAAELEQLAREADWPRLLSDRPPRAERTYRRKTDDYGFLVDFDVGVRKDGLIIPPGIIQGQNLNLQLRRELLPVATVNDFDQLPIPFRAVATNLLTGEAVVLGAGDLAMAIRASMSIPGLFKPVHLDGKLLVDGGATNNLPVEIAKAMGADVLIVVDVGSPLLEEKDLNSVLDITSQMMTISIQAQSEQQRQLMQTGDILIRPQLGLFSTQAYDRSSLAMALGEEAARQSTSELAQYSLAEPEYVAYRQSLERARPGVPEIQQVAFENESKLSIKVLQARVEDQRGKQLDVSQLEANLADIYAFDTFETVDYSIRTRDDGNELLIRSPVKSWGPNYLRFGINLEDDFDGNSNYNVAARFTKTEINGRGGELRGDFVLGENPQLGLELFQPIDYGSRWFINPVLRLQRENIGRFDSGIETARLRSDVSDLSLGMGRSFGNWGEIRLTLSRSFTDSKVSIGDPLLEGNSNNTSSLSMNFAYDTIDRIAIPRSGTNLQLNWLGTREGIGSDQDVDAFSLVLLKPQTRGKNTLLHWWDVMTIDYSGDTPIDFFQLGGLFNLSGYAPGELRGSHRAVGRMLFYHRVGNQSMDFFNTPFYVGASAEIGNVWQSRSDISFNNTQAAGSIFLVFDTLLGPLYLAYGMAEGDRNSAYLFLGQTF